MSFVYFKNVYLNIKKISLICLIIFLGEVKTQNEKRCNSIEPNTMILDKLKCEMLKLSSNLIEKKTYDINKNSGFDKLILNSKRSLISDNNNLPKRIKIDSTLLTSDQINVLEELINIFHKHNKRPPGIGFSEFSILSETELCEISKRVAQLFPDKEIKIPAL